MATLTEKLTLDDGEITTDLAFIYKEYYNATVDEKLEFNALNIDQGYPPITVLLMGEHQNEELEADSRNLNVETCKLAEINDILPHITAYDVPFIIYFAVDRFNKLSRSNKDHDTKLKGFRLISQLLTNCLRKIKTDKLTSDAIFCIDAVMGSIRQAIVAINQDAGNVPIVYTKMPALFETGKYGFFIDEEKEELVAEETPPVKFEEDEDDKPASLVNSATKQSNETSLIGAVDKKPKETTKPAAVTKTANEPIKTESSSSDVVLLVNCGVTGGSVNVRNTIIGEIMEAIANDNSVSSFLLAGKFHTNGTNVFEGALKQLSEPLPPGFYHVAENETINSYVANWFEAMNYKVVRAYR